MEFWIIFDGISVEKSHEYVRFGFVTRLEAAKKLHLPESRK